MTMKQEHNGVKGLYEGDQIQGSRGCRRTSTSPDIWPLRRRAIFEASLEWADDSITVRPDIDVPLRGSKHPLASSQDILDTTAENVY